jgi:hydroxymethylpyrimidine/phosphomethylpyrimidine kinase
VTTARVLVIAGSDSGAGAGIQADLKTIAALGGYATTAVTALTAQDTTGVHAVLPVPADFVRRQIEAVLGDIGADAVKTGMLGSAAVVAAVAETLAAMAPAVPLVIDPVMVSTSGTRLLDADAVDALTRLLLPRAAVLTPNVPEAEALTGLAIGDLDAMKRAAERLHAAGSPAVLLKGGHLDGGIVRDVYCGPEGITVLESPRIATRHSHGTGCTLASAIAVGLAQGMPMVPAIRRARAYLLEALRHAPGLGAGNGPLGHFPVLRRPTE